MTRAVHACDARRGRMTVEQAARWIGCDEQGSPVVSAAVVLRAVRRGQIRATKVGGRWLLAPEDIDAWLDARTVGGDEP